MIRRLLPHPLLSPILAVIWLLLVNEFSVGHALLGLLLGWLIPVFTLNFWPEKVRIFRPLRLFLFSFLVVYDIAVANIKVAFLILGPTGKLKPAFVRLPLDLHSDLAISLLANTISLTPGTVSAELSPDRRYLLVHVLHAQDGESLVSAMKSRYEAPIKEIFEG